MKIELVKGDIFFISCDAIVNPTDVKLSGSGGLDRELRRRAGEEVDRQCAGLRKEMKPGGTVVTSGGFLPVRWILHTAAPDCGRETGDWRTDPTHPFALSNANTGGLLVFQCLNCGTTIRLKHFKDEVVCEHTLPSRPRA